MNKTGRDARNSILLGMLLFLLSFSTYILTLCPTVYWYDSGELISACFNLGIAHPTGYPLYTILGRIFSLLPFENPAYRVNIMSAFFGALTVTAIYAVTKILMAMVWRDAVHKRSDTELSRFFENEAPAIVAALTFAFSPLYWTQNVIAEVYTLHTLLIALLIFSLCRWSQSSSRSSRSSENENTPEDHNCQEKADSQHRHVILFSFILGMSLSHHLTTLLFAPAFLFFVAADDIRVFRNIKILTIALLFFLLGLSVDLYLLLRAGLDPIQNWGDPGTWDRFLDVITGAEIRSRPTRYASHSIAELFSLLGKQFLLPGIALGAIGIFSTIRRKKTVFVFFSLFFVGMLLYILRNYDFLEDQYLPVFLVFCMWIGLGVKELLSFISHLTARSSPRLKVFTVTATTVIVFTIPFFLIATGCSSVDKSDHRAAYTYGKTISEHLEESTIFLSEGSNIPLLLDYFQRVEGYRADVATIYLFLMEFDWYRKQLADRFPDISIPALPQNIVHSLIEQNVSHHRVYYLPFSKEPNVEINRLIPHGLFFRIEPERTIPSKSELEEHLRIQDRFYNTLRGPLDQDSKDILAQTHGTMGLYFQRIGLYDEAYREYTKALDVDSLNPGVHYDLGSLATERGRYREAIQNFQKVLEIEPSNINTRYELAQCYSQTGQLVQAIREMETVVRADPNEPLFHTDLGILYGGAGKTELAIEQFTKALEYDPDNADILYNLGIAEARSGRPAMAVRHLKQAEKRDPNNIEVMRALASSYAGEKEYGNSERYFRKILKLGGPNPTVLADLGHLYLESGNFEKAFEMWEASLALDPSNARLQTELDRLREKMGTHMKTETGDRIEKEVK